MKKGLALVISLCMLVAVFAVAGCSPKEEDGAVKMGLGINTSIAKSRDMAGDVLAQAQVDTTMAAVAFDKEGRIVKVQIDVAQVRVAYNAEMQVTSDKTEVLKTKKERGNDYNMKRVSNIGKEWFEQIAALEEWMIGKTVAEVKALKVKVVDDAHQHVPDVPELTSSVTITVESYIAAVEKAWQNAIDVEGLETLGLGQKISIGKSRDASADVTAQAQVDTTIAATGFDKDGKVIATLIDVAQVRVAFDAEGKVSSDKSANVMTKKERGNDYNMKRVSNIGKEWFEQMAAFEEWMVGKTVSEIKGLKVKVVDAAHQNVPDVPELTSSVTITVESYIAAVEEAFANKR